MRHIPVYCPEFIMNVKPGQQLAGCDWKGIWYVGDNKFMLSYYQAGTHVTGFSQARLTYNNLPMLSPEELAGG
jgi:hypothetical protein